MLKNYHEFISKNNFDLGLQMGRAFRRASQMRLTRQKRIRTWRQQIEMAKKFIPPTKKYFPHLLEEFRGYALGAQINFEELWAANMEDELFGYEKCTTVITNNGKLIAHSEDAYVNKEKNEICLLKKTLGGLTIFEIFYLNTLGGNAISINSHGVVQSANTVYPDKHKIGVPKNILARWLSETKNPLEAAVKLKTIKRSGGYNYNFTDLSGKIVNIEYTCDKISVSQPSSPFVHTNQYLSGLRKFDAYPWKSSPFRYDFAKKHAREQMPLEAVKRLLCDVSSGKNSVRNIFTVADAIFDLKKRAAYIWLLRENEKGFVKFDLNFLR